jgi:HEAT repeat protein
MKALILLLTPILAVCADQTPVQRLFDGKLTVSQRTTACFELRGNREPDVVNSMAKALEDPALLACATDNLRIAGAVETLQQALSNPDAQVRAAAVRQLGTFQKPELLDVISRAAQEENLLVSTNALAGLNEYQNPVVIPYLAILAKRGGMVGDMALDRLSQLESTTALGIARGLLASSQVPDRLYAMRVIGAFGDASDLAELNKIARSTPENLSQRNRGFGFMPAINLARAAQSAMASIQSRQKKA